MSVDPRVPFAITVAEGLLLLGLVTLLAYQSVPRLPILVTCILIFYLITAGIVLWAFAIRFAEYKKAEQEAEELNKDIYQMFRSATHIPYAVINADGNLRIINEAMQKILGFRSPVCNIPLAQACPGITVEQLNEIVRKNLADQEDNSQDGLIPKEVFPITYDDRDEESTSVVRLCNGCRYRMETHLLQKGNDHYYFVIFHDVTRLLNLILSCSSRRVKFMFFFSKV